MGCRTRRPPAGSKHARKAGLKLQTHCVLQVSALINTGRIYDIYMYYMYYTYIYIINDIYNIHDTYMIYMIHTHIYICIYVTYICICVY